ncbi:hypothetical protein JL721_413 [Aureococcus anophagefferens]|nr:hypothetical protein JL721_413 [Aureococcus anophagefferens]
MREVVLEDEVKEDPAPTPAILEACCDSRESVRNAVAGGASRVEVCGRGSLHCGGLTPSPTLVSLCLGECAASAVEVVALVRVRGGDFVYCREEVEEMCAEIRSLRKVGCRVRTGCLAGDGGVDLEATATLVAAARAPAGAAGGAGDLELEGDGDVVVVFHRAVDEVLRRTTDLQKMHRLVEALRRLTVNRILSSGGGQTARGGRSTLWALQKACKRHGVALCLAGGVTAASAPVLVADTGATELHANSALTEEAAARRGAAPGDHGALTLERLDLDANAGSFFPDPTAFCSAFALPKTAWPLLPL